jgi:TPP-dependent pyruvate/acetoin dehydrogenase alpha subunit
LCARVKLVSNGLMSEADLDAPDAAVAEEMDRSIEFSVAGDEPQLASMFRDVCDPSQPEPDPVRTRLDRVLAEG